jgi:hypothetical protein
VAPAGHDPLGGVGALAGAMHVGRGLDALSTVGVTDVLPQQAGELLEYAVLLSGTGNPTGAAAAALLHEVQETKSGRRAAALVD